MKELLLDLRLFASLLLISLLLILVDSRHLLDLPKRALQVVTTPIEYGLYRTYLGVAKQFEFVVSARTAAQDKQALQEQLSQILSENANLRRQLNEAQAINSQAKALNPSVYPYIQARPLGLVDGRYLRIDKGADDGIKMNLPVVYKDNLLGQISSLSPKESLVRLITDPDSKIAAFVNNQSGKAKGRLSGQFRSEMLMDQILHSEMISKNDLVYTEGIEGSLPRGLILGQVTSVDEGKNGLFKEAKVKTVFDIGDLDLVFVITE